jgi:hypothetical protein
MNQSYQQNLCRKDLATVFLEKESFEEYQKKREDL